MNTTTNTILITGGGSGIGFETARLLSAKGNKVIITGRGAERLNAAVAQLPDVMAIQADITKEADVNRLVNTLKRDFPELNIVMNNAGHAVLYPLAETPNVSAIAQEEMLTNFFAVLHLNAQLLPLLQQQKEAAIVNVSSIVAYVPGRLATYSASKAALHSYTQSLRIALENTPVKVFELFPPLVNTEFSRPIGGESGIAPELVAQELVSALENDSYEVRVGQTEDLYQLHRTSPEEALRIMQP